MLRATSPVNLGVTTNSNAAAGQVGEYVTAVANNVTAAATTQYQDTITISLTAGDWDAAGNWQCSPGAGATLLEVGISIGTAGNTFSDPVRGDNQIYMALVATSTNVSLAIPAWRISIAATTTIRMKTNYTYVSGAPTTFGRLSARRVR